MPSTHSINERLSAHCNASTVGMAMSFMHDEGGFRSHIEALAFTTRGVMNFDSTALRKSADDLHAASLYRK